MALTKEFLDQRVAASLDKGYDKQKWIHFCEIMMRRGYELSLYEARRTVSKYITVKKGNKQFKVRFSNHKPISSREDRGDCDFFVGRTNFTVTTMADAVRATINFIEFDRKPSINSDFTSLTTKE